jgi:hypothetical protein
MPLKRQAVCELHCITTQKTIIFTGATVRASDPTIGIMIEETSKTDKGNCTDET